MFKHLGRILYSTRNASWTAVAVEEFLQIYVDQSDFIECFRKIWLPKLGTISSWLFHYVGILIVYNIIINHGMKTLT